MSEKKMVRRSVAIAVGILCIILIAGIAGVLAYYTMTLNDKNALYNDYVSSHGYTNYEVANLTSSARASYETWELDEEIGTSEMREKHVSTAGYREVAIWIGAWGMPQFYPNVTLEVMVSFGQYPNSTRRVDIFNVSSGEYWKTYSVRGPEMELRVENPQSHPRASFHCYIYATA